MANASTPNAPTVVAALPSSAPPVPVTALDILSQVESVRSSSRTYRSLMWMLYATPRPTVRLVIIPVMTWNGIPSRYIMPRIHATLITTEGA